MGGAVWASSFPWPFADEAGHFFVGFVHHKAKKHLEGIFIFIFLKFENRPFRATPSDIPDGGDTPRTKKSHDMSYPNGGPPRAQEEVSAADSLVALFNGSHSSSLSTATETSDASSSIKPSPRKPPPSKSDATAKEWKETKEERKRATPASPRDASLSQHEATRKRAAPMSPTTPVDERKMPAIRTASVKPPAETASEDDAPAVDVPSLQMVTKETYFADLIHGMDAEAYIEYARSVCEDDAAKLAGMVVDTVRFHMARCDKKTNLVEILKAFHSALSPGFAKLINASKLRNAYNNPVFNSSKTLEAPLGPSLHLPPGVMPVNVHQIGSVGQFCSRGAEKCVALTNAVAPEFTSVAFSSTGGTSNTQLCTTCHDCYAEDGFDPARTFGTKGEFDNYMSAYATKHNFKLTKETGPTVSVGATKVPRYVAVACTRNRPIDVDRTATARLRSWRR